MYACRFQVITTTFDNFRWITQINRKDKGHSMNINTIIIPELVINLKSTLKEEALVELITLINEKVSVDDIKSVKKNIFYRESLMSTGIGLHIGIPHIRMSGIDKPIIAIGIQPDGISDYEAIDNLQIKLVVMIICGEHQQKIYIRILSQIVSLLKKNNNINNVIAANSISEVYYLLTES